MIRIASCAVLLAAAASFAPAAFAAKGEPVTDCVDLGDDQEIVRAGGGQQFFLRNGNEHYRVSFQHSCDSILTTPRVDISTQGQANRLCAADTRVKTKRDTCRVAHRSSKNPSCSRNARLCASSCRLSKNTAW